MSFFLSDKGPLLLNLGLPFGKDLTNDMKGGRFLHKNHENRKKSLGICFCFLRKSLANLGRAKAGESNIEKSRGK